MANPKKNLAVYVELTRFEQRLMALLESGDSVDLGDMVAYTKLKNTIVQNME